MPTDSKAEQAMQQALTTDDLEILASKNVIDIFVESFEIALPGGLFSTRDVYKWLEIYKVLEGDLAIPKLIRSPVSLGRFLRNNQELLGITESGMYGNRFVYTRKGVKDGKPS